MKLLTDLTNEGSMRLESSCKGMTYKYNNKYLFFFLSRTRRMPGLSSTGLALDGIDVEHLAQGIVTL